MQLRPNGADHELFPLRIDFEIALLQAEDAQKVDEVALEEALRAQVLELFLRKTQATQMLRLGSHVTDQLAQRVLGSISTHEAVNRLVLRKRVQERLQHRVFIEIGIE